MSSGEKKIMGNLTDRGFELFSEIRDVERVVELRDQIEAGRFGSAMMALAVDFVFGSIWTRPGLNRKERSLVTLSDRAAPDRRVQESRSDRPAQRT
jgi:4-carboxymuconolactone decarboxylase